MKDQIPGKDINLEDRVKKWNEIADELDKEL